MSVWPGGGLTSGTPAAQDALAQTLPVTGVIAQTMPRTNLVNVAVLATGQESTWGVYLVAGQVLTSISFVAGTQAAVAPTNQWFTVRNSSRTLVGITVDDTTTAWNAGKTLALSATYTVPTTGLYYFGCMVAAGTPPSLLGAASGGSPALSQAPALAGRDSTAGLTTPATADATLTFDTPLNNMIYAYAK